MTDQLMRESLGELTARKMELEKAIREVVTTEENDICWLDVYQKLARLVGMEFNPKLLPRERFRRNCDRFADSIYTGCPYGVDLKLEQLRKAHEQALVNLYELRTLFDMRHAADMRAIDRWRKAKAGRELRQPDHADMVVFLLDELEKVEQEAEQTHQALMEEMR